MALPCHIVPSLMTQSFPAPSKISWGKPAKELSYKFVPCAFWEQVHANSVLDQPPIRTAPGRKETPESLSSGRLVDSTGDQPNGIALPNPSRIVSDLEQRLVYDAVHDIPEDSLAAIGLNARERREARRAKERALLQEILALNSREVHAKKDLRRSRRVVSGEGSDSNGRSSGGVAKAVGMVLRALRPQGDENGVKANVKHVTAAVKVLASS